MSKRVSPGTRTEEVAAALIHATTTLGRGATVAEIWTAYATMFESTMPSRNCQRALQRLEARGEAARIGGRHGRTQWHHVKHPVPFVDHDDAAPLLAEAVESLYVQHARAVSSAEVADEARRRGRPLSSEQARHRLETLAHTSSRKRARSHEDWRESRIQRIETVTAGGRRLVYWAPEGVAADLPEIADGRDAVRHAIGRAVEAVGRPVSRREVRLWGQVQLKADDVEPKDREAAKIVTSKSFRGSLSTVARFDEGHGEEGRVRVARTFLSSRGAYGPRFAAAPISVTQAAACLVEDLAGLFRPETEANSIADLRAYAREVGSHVLIEMADSRERALHSALLRSTPSDLRRPKVLNEACSVALSAREQVELWRSQATPYRSAFATDDAEIEGFMRAAHNPGCGEGDDLITIDRIDGCPTMAFESLALEALAIGERDVRYWSPLLTAARRIRGPVTGGNSWQDPSDTQSLLDRPDALVSIVESCHLPTMSALVSTAYAALGYVVRDEKWLLSCLERLGGGEGETRQALVVALGLLGSPPAIEEAWPDPHDPEQAAAYYASIALGVDDEDERRALGRAADRRAKGAAVEISDQALLELEDGVRLGVVG